MELTFQLITSGTIKGSSPAPPVIILGLAFEDASHFFQPHNSMPLLRTLFRKFTSGKALLRRGFKGLWSKMNDSNFSKRRGMGRARILGDAPKRTQSPPPYPLRTVGHSFPPIDPADNVSASISLGSSDTRSTTSTLYDSSDTISLSSSQMTIHSIPEEESGPSERFSTSEDVKGLAAQGETFPTREGVSKQGTKGSPINLNANYFRLKDIPALSLHQYFADFDPEEERTFIRKKMFRRALAALGVDVGYMFDGTQLFSAGRLENMRVPLSLTVKDEVNADASPVSINLEYVGAVKLGSAVHVQAYNILIRKFMFALDLQEMGNNFYDPAAAIQLPMQRLELWPGFITSLRNHDSGLLLCVEVAHKVLRTDSVLHIIRGIESTGNFRGDRKRLKEAVNNELKDTIVMTVYNRKTYHVVDMDFEMNPGYTFEWKGTMVSIADYYKSRYGLEISDMAQPLILSRPSKKFMKRDKEATPTLLVPEMCRSTGLNDAMRGNFNLMKELTKYLHQGPKERAQVIKQFMKRLKGNDVIRRDMAVWGLEFYDDLMPLTGRVLPNETMIFAKGTQPVDKKGDFTTAFRTQKMLSGVELRDWVILVQRRDETGVPNLLNTMRKVASPLGINIKAPKHVIGLPDPKIQTYIREVEEAVKRDRNLQLVFVILPNNKADLYAAIKRRLTVDYGIPSQCFLSKNVTSKGLMSIATKLVVQINAKLGGEPWTIKLPLNKTMFIGFDVYRGGKGNKGGTVGAMVATFSANFTKYFSTTSVYNDSEDAAKRMRADIAKCVEAFREENQGLPERIIMCRDGVSEGQINMIYTVEVKNIKGELDGIYTAEGCQPPALTYIIVSKKINTKLFDATSHNLENPPPGTVVDTVVTLPEKHDFYMISCAARQGTVSPCSYHVITNESNFDADKLQLIVYKLCHMYFNWSGTIACPSPCQYAHKLAALTAVEYTGQAKECLSKRLHFL